MASRPLADGAHASSCRNGNELGDFSVAVVNKDPLVIVINLYGQSLTTDSLAGCRTNYDAVLCGLQKIKEFCNTRFRHRVPSEVVIGFPKFMGCGLGGGNWNI